MNVTEGNWSISEYLGYYWRESKSNSIVHNYKDTNAVRTNTTIRTHNITNLEDDTYYELYIIAENKFGVIVKNKTFMFKTS